MTTKTKTTGKKTTKKVTMAVTAKSTTKKPSKTAVDATPLPDPCAEGHKWDKDGEGVEHCTVCLADRQVIEKGAKKKGAKTESPKPANAAKPDGKLSALDAAAQVLASATAPLNAKQMIEQMTAQGLWTSPGGKTPHATLYSAISREIQAKGKDARFKKTERGHFAVNG